MNAATYLARMDADVRALADYLTQTADELAAELVERRGEWLAELDDVQAHRVVLGIVSAALVGGWRTAAAAATAEALHWRSLAEAPEAPPEPEPTEEGTPP